MAGVHPDDRDRVQAEIETALQTADHFEVEHRLTTDPDCWLLVKGQRVCGPLGSPTIWVGVSIDISDRKRAEMALQKSETRLRAIIEQTAVGINEADINSGRFIFVNQPFCDLLGYTAAELKALSFAEITHPEDLAANASEIARLYREEVPFLSVEKRYVTKAGNALWAQVTLSLVRDETGKPYADLAIVVNIHNHKQAELALQTSEARLRGIFEQTAVGINEVDPLSGRFLSVNQRFCEMVGYTQAELLQMTFAQITHPEDLSKTHGDWVLLRRGGLPFISFEKRYLAKSAAVLSANFAPAILTVR